MGKIYIGQTMKSLTERACKNGSNYKDCTHFYNAIKYYGQDNFNGEILKDNLTKDEADYWESYYIAYYDSTNPDIGYNIEFGGHQGPISQETRKKISDKAKERYKDPTKNPMYGKHCSEEAKKKMREKNSGKKCQCYGMHLSQETKDKISKAHIGKPSNTNWTPELRQLRSELSREMAMKLFARKVHCIEDDLNFDSIKDAADYYHVSKSTLCGHLKGNQKSCAGKHFEYAE